MNTTDIVFLMDDDVKICGNGWNMCIKNITSCLTLFHEVAQQMIM